MNAEKLKSLGFVKSVRACNIHYRALSKNNKTKKSHEALLIECNKVSRELFNDDEKSFFRFEESKPKSENVFVKGIFA
jgi:hypothetical protein